jgi:DNA-binding CsgD family transcriptional regulator
MTAHESGHIRRNGLWLTALVADAAGDDRGALSAAAEAVATLDRRTPSFNGWPDPADEVVLVRMALRGGQERAAVRAVEAAERRAALNPGYPVAVALAVQARGSADRGRGLPAQRGAPARRHRASPPARLRSRGPRPRRRHGRPREAVGLLDQALLAYGTAGAEHDAARARGRLRDLGVRRRRAAVPSERRDGFEGLTPTEREVVALVAEGRTNAQVATRMYVSPHTVNTHLRNAFLKLGVQSRVELARLVAARGGGTPR